MYKLLVFLVLTTSVGQFKCQDNLAWYFRGVRRYDECPEQNLRIDGVCVPIFLSRVAAPQYVEGGCINDECVDSCPPGQERDRETNECVTRRFAFRRLAAPDVFKAGCIPGQAVDPVTGFCLTCPPGQERDAQTNECVTIVTRRFVDDCPDGYITNDKGECVPIALRRLAAPDVFKAGCIPGQAVDPVTGFCITCPPGQERDAQTNECVTIVTRRFVDDCPDGYITNDKGQCVPIALRRLAAPDVFKAGCIPGQAVDPVTGLCLTCPPGQERDGETNECVTIVTKRFAFRMASPEVVEGGCINGQTRDPKTGECVTIVDESLRHLLDSIGQTIVNFVIERYVG